MNAAQIPNSSASESSPPPLSVIVPAWNEEASITATIQAIVAATDRHAPGAEIIVVDDDSSDQTAARATAAGARVLPVARRHIAAVRNEGAAVARSDRLLFVDADTIVSPEAVRAALDALDAGWVGGGARVVFDRRVPFWAGFVLWGVMVTSRALRLATGCFVFCRAEDFHAVDGFDETLYATEEIALSAALKRRGRFGIVAATVTTSARKVETYGMWRTMKLMLRVATRGPGTLRSREGLEVWYGDGDAVPRETESISEARATPLRPKLPR
ncbi:MAG: glycosyltransferase [Phycisphaerales bacterium]